MNSGESFKIECRSCAVNIEFPKHGVGTVVRCPKCAELVTLTKPPISRKIVGAWGLVVAYQSFLAVAAYHNFAGAWILWLLGLLAIPVVLVELPPASRRCLLTKRIAFGLVAVAVFSFLSFKHNPNPDESVRSLFTPDQTLSSGVSNFREPLTGVSPAAESTIREIENERPGYLKAEDRELIRALILVTPDPK